MGLEEIVEILCCPACRGELDVRLEDDALDCPSCRLRYVVEGGVLNMIPSEALEREKE